MAEQFTTEQLEAVLISIGHHLDLPSDLPELTPVDRPEGRRRTGRLLVAAAALVVLVGGVVVVPSTRTAIADLLGLGSTRVEIIGDEPAQVGLLHVADGLTPVSHDEATSILGGRLPDATSTALGPPEAVYRMPEGGVLLAWRDDTATLWVRPATDGGIVIRKLIGSNASVEPVDDLGTEALIISGTHVLQTPQRRLAAQQVLLWYDDDREYRFEADIAPDDLIGMARDLR